MHPPLAAHMRPQTFEHILGQGHLVGPTGVFNAWVKQGFIPSFVLWGPPGTGKTTLAQSLAKQLQGLFLPFSAVTATVKDLRAAGEQAKNSLQKTYLFLDEIHRFNKSQQDTLLPFIEEGILTLMGATTENPSFALNRALLSRVRILKVLPLTENDLYTLLQEALKDTEKGLGAYHFDIEPKAADLMVQKSGGDARYLLTHLESAAFLALSKRASLITQSMAQDAIGHTPLPYDRAGDQHYDILSAFIKSLRGSDPQAACYYLVRMLESGEEPKLILRRMMIFASEDIGNADPQALQIAVSAATAFDWIGMPEAYLNLTHAALYLACAPKSNGALKAYQKAKKDMENFGHLPIPLHLRNAPTALLKEQGNANGYLYPHDFEHNYVTQTYLPASLEKRIYYTPTQNGYERFIAQRLKQNQEKDQIHENSKQPK